MSFVSQLRRASNILGDVFARKELRRFRLATKYGRSMSCFDPPLDWQSEQFDDLRVDCGISFSTGIPDQCPDLNCARADEIMLYCVRFDIHLTGRPRGFQSASDLSPEQAARNREAAEDLFVALEHDFSSPLESWAVPIVRSETSEVTRLTFRRGRYLGQASTGQHLFAGSPDEIASAEELERYIFGVLMIGGPICTLAKDQA